MFFPVVSGVFVLCFVIFLFSENNFVFPFVVVVKVMFWFGGSCGRIRGRGGVGNIP